MIDLQASFAFSTSLLRRVRSGLVPTIVLAAAGCSGGGSGGTVEGLTLPDQMSVVTAGGSALQSGAAGTQSNASLFEPEADYNTDEQHTWVYDPSMDPLGTVNMILCILKQTGYADMVNLGPYLAQIDEQACEKGSDQNSSDTGQSSGSNATQPSLWTIRSARASGVADQIVECWMPEHDEEGGMATVQVEMHVSQGVSDTNPFGVFVLNFAGVPEGGTLDDAVFKGTLRALDATLGSVGFSFYQEEGDVTQPPAQNEHASLVQANVSMSADQTLGVARIRRQERSNFPPSGDTGIVTSEYQIAFDPAQLLRSQDGDPGICLSRTAFDTRVGRYSLYDSATGARIDRNSGFGFRTQAGDYGWIGYWGLWVPPEAKLESGDTITKDVYGESDPETYTLVLAPGKLIKNSKHVLDLADIGGETFDWWDYGTPGDPPPSRPTQYRVLYRTGSWDRVAAWNEETMQYDTLRSPVAIDVAAFGHLGMWSQSLGGQVGFVDGESFITYYAREFVNGASDLFSGGAGEVDLYGYFNCLASGITESQANLGDAYLPPSNDVTMPYHYVFQKDDLTLYYDTDGLGTLEPAGLAAGAVPQTGPFTWGMQSGPMLLSTAGLIDPNQAWSQDVFYTYETGANLWNQYAAVVDQLGDGVAFDPPLQFTYTHATENDRNGDSTYADTSYLLSYGGRGDLFGIPSHGIDLDSDGNPDRWYPLFSIEDGVVMGPTGAEFVVKAIEMEQTLSEDPGNCAGLDLTPAGLLVLPDASGYTAPDIGPPPPISDPPRVIEGVVQGP